VKIAEPSSPHATSLVSISTTIVPRDKSSVREHRSIIPGTTGNMTDVRPISCESTLPSWSVYDIECETWLWLLYGDHHSPLTTCQETNPLCHEYCSHQATYMSLRISAAWVIENFCGGSFLTHIQVLAGAWSLTCCWPEHATHNVLLSCPGRSAHRRTCRPLTRSFQSHVT